MYNIKILNLFDPELQLINTNSIIKNELKELLSALKKFKVHSKLVLQYKKKKKMIVKLFYSSVKLIAMNQTLMKHSNPCLKA